MLVPNRITFPRSPVFKPEKRLISYWFAIVESTLSQCLLVIRPIDCDNTSPGLTAQIDGSGSTRPDTTSARESTRPRVNSAGSTRPLIFPITGGVFYKYMMFLDIMILG